MPRHEYEPTGVHDDGVIRTGVRGDRNRLTGFHIVFSDGVTRTFYAATLDLAEEYASTWGLARGGLTIQRGA